VSVQIYAAFNSNGVSVVVSAAELDDATRNAPPLSTELADAAAQAHRTDLIGHLRASLTGDDSAQKLAAAKALLALDDRDAGALLQSMSTTESDGVVAKSYLAIATRLRGPQTAMELFEAPDTDPQLARLLVSNYNSHLRPRGGDVRFLVRALEHYLRRNLPWLSALRASLWNNGVYLIVDALSSQTAMRLLGNEEHRPERDALLPMLGEVQALAEDDDLVADAGALRAALSGD
jgi:hypothetical protein